MSKSKKLPHVELLNVPSYRQGDFDSLCTYYTAAMMLSTLFPDYAETFGEAARMKTTNKVSNDPLITNYSKEDNRLVLARWFYQGEYIKKATTILNNIMRTKPERTRFQWREETAHDNTFDDVIAESINCGLPVMLGWNTPDYGNHAVLVVGYWEGHEKWLLINDPGSGEDQVSWNSLKAQKKRKFEVGLCRPETHHGYRPLKRVGNGSGTTLSRWTPNGYKQVSKDFD